VTTSDTLKLEYAPSFDAVRGEWDRLAQDGPGIFASWEWATAWWSHFGRGSQPLLARCREGGRTLALLPMYAWPQRGLRVVRFLGHGPADELGPLCASADRTATAAALKLMLADVRGDVFLGEQLRAEEHWPQRLGASVRGSQPSPKLRLRARSWDEFLANRSKNFRGQVGRRERALERLGLRYRLCDDGDRLEHDLDILFALHRAQWRGRDSNFTRLEAFHRDFATAAFARGWLRLWFLEVNGGDVAAWYGLRFEGIDFYYQAGRDPQWDRFAVGFVLLGHSLREAISDGMREYRFGRGGEEYKSRFTDDDSRVETVVLPRRLKGRVAVAAVAAARRRTPARRLIRAALRT
jgi:CelD/BcsL family acetyltransferase involved in cellulose biosynthesis